MLLGVSLENLPLGPLDREKMEPVFGLAYLDRFDDIGVLDPGAVSRLSEKAGNGSLILTQLLP